MSTRHSGLQKEVFSLYRRALRMVNLKPEQARQKFLLYVRYTFKSQAAAVPPRNISAIEHMLRRGRRQLEMYEDSKVRDCWVSKEMLEWGKQNPGRSVQSRPPT
ncbi:hypothetical protein OBBRIDRAFT_797240 [Obba rivulosa]|uniref:Complex 1 LYR protein domain-containing protein n=1 Tax=Obba rivulosa TaxID=1052685 RepID=A0A8E2DGW0_9APHY|nr:hypothetical protein OBBRIDRAFT_797240 [Obba rivulosa]